MMSMLIRQEHSDPVLLTEVGYPQEVLFGGRRGGPLRWKGTGWDLNQTLAPAWACAET